MSFVINLTPQDCPYLEKWDLVNVNFEMNCSSSNINIALESQGEVYQPEGAAFNFDVDLADEMWQEGLGLLMALDASGKDATDSSSWF